MKDAYYFSHDSNARHDPKICMMRSDYGGEGYGWYWIIVEMLRDETEYKMRLQFVRYAVAMQLQCAPDAAEKYIDDCIKRYELFASDGDFFWSNSLIRRMEKRQVKSQKARKSAFSRWQDANALQMECERNANALQMECERNANALRTHDIKGKERKEKERKEKDIYRRIQHLTLAHDEYRKLCDTYGTEETDDILNQMENYAGLKKYRSAFLTATAWLKRRKADAANTAAKPQAPVNPGPGNPMLRAAGYLTPAEIFADQDRRYKADRVALGLEPLP